MFLLKFWRETTLRTTTSDHNFSLKKVLSWVAPFHILQMFFGCTRMLTWGTHLQYSAFLCTYHAYARLWLQLLYFNYISLTSEMQWKKRTTGIQAKRFRIFIARPFISGKLNPRSKVSSFLVILALASSSHLEKVPDNFFLCHLYVGDVGQSNISPYKVCKEHKPGNGNSSWNLLF